MIAKKCFLFEILSALLQRRLTTKLWFSSKVLKAWNCFQGLLYDLSLYMTKTTFPLKRIPVIPTNVTYFTPKKLVSLPRHSHFADVFVLVCISLLCVTKAFSVICHSHRQLLIHRRCTKWSLVHPLQCAWICTASFFVTWYQRESVTVDAQDQNLQCFKSRLQKVLDGLFEINQLKHCECFLKQWSMQIYLTHFGNAVLKEIISPGNNVHQHHCIVKQVKCKSNVPKSDFSYSSMLH